MRPDVLSIGAGPVGAWHAILLKKCFPEINILLFEQYFEPKRNQVLHLDKSCFRGAENFPDLKQFVDELPENIQINELEIALLEILRTLNIPIQYEKINDPKSLFEKYPTAKVLVGSDGFHSRVRQEYFENTTILIEGREGKKNEDEPMALPSFGSIYLPEEEECVKEGPHFSKEDLQYFALINYKVQGDTRPLSSWLELPKLLVQGHYMFSEHVGKEKDGVRTITMRCIIDKETYHALRGPHDNLATAKNPLTFSEITQIAPLLADTIMYWKIARKESIGETQLLGEPMISTTILSVCQNDKVYQLDKENRLILLVGEAFAAVPFYRSVNMCLEATFITVHAIGIYLGLESKYLSHQDKSNDYNYFSSTSLFSENKVPTTLKECEDEVKRIVSWETFKAKMKSVGFDQIAATRRVAASSYQSSVVSSETSIESGRTLLNVFSYFRQLSFLGKASCDKKTEPAFKRVKRS